MLCGMGLAVTKFNISRVTKRVFFFKQKTAYEMRISDWSSDVCSSDLPRALDPERAEVPLLNLAVAISVLPRLLHRLFGRSEERRVGKECVSTCRSRWSRYHSKTTPLEYTR